MYSSPFYITNPVGNNAFSFEKRDNKKLYVPSLVKSSSFDDIKFGNEVVFEDFDFDDKLQSCKGLQNFYEFDYSLGNSKQIQTKFLLLQEGQLSKKLYLFDNHNHAYFFWYKAKQEGIIKNNSILYHMDEHADTRDPGIYLEKAKLDDLQNVFYYTNFTLNVGNYIIPAIKDGLIKEVVQIRSETELLNVKGLINEYVISSGAEKSVEEINNEINSNNQLIDPRIKSEDDKGKQQSIILNLDLDFFQPDLDFIDYNLKKEIVQKLASKASVITVATSPFFINQKLALEVFKDLFDINIK